MNDRYALILAAGKGTRMKSKKYKVLHPVCGKPMVQHVVDAAKRMNPQKTILVVGHGAEDVRQQLGPDVTYVLQEQQLGTGHAVKVAKDQLEGKQGHTLILYGDTPLITAEVLEELIQFHEEEQAIVTILTANMDNPTGYGRIVRDRHGNVLKIVEHKDASTQEKEIQEINTGIYCFSNEHLVNTLDKLTNQNAQGEYYITDCIEILKKQNHKVAAFLTEDTDVTHGVNDRIALAEAEKLMRLRINKQHMLQGVTIIDPENTYIGPDVTIGMDTTILPGTILSGHTVIGEDCVIGPYAELRHVHIGDGVAIEYAVLVESEVGDTTTVGPYAYIRPGSSIGKGSKIGDFVEIKNSTIGDGAKIPHLSYVGDADIGAKVNMGCGSLTVNYDGSQKHRTVVEEGSFVGCNVNLVAPVQIGPGAYIAAGSTITDSMPGDSFAIARQRQVTKENYAQKLKEKKKTK
ncbi:bifunctional UDP-N-acetylglucosamine diphosphorylase/glucosamine-1-phosphate N-acetyltransferase GlmU [Bacillus horti]|uniref:Bifunctional protein GlmU n=1 Tax=Caldalkalibacillus horti TaxID=77523 RepID=A0ABT9W2U5_9BACI|nr:bifunctional UDP-N-acetylglucosamine diphosphorylase/glucosamine-1-phosphate N-acetyltransferase GlmU [Bacillus horti]MDQ0167578.1 bifunctional UDP-N-acetylglucosamine pyrophosphorylase/glucosamine-1-phosphate N-acetyltransferase [Bacillus horti]